MRRVPLTTAIGVVCAGIACAPFGEASGRSRDGGVGDASDGDPAPAHCFALSFDGRDSFVSVADAADLDPVGPSTIEAWVKLTKSDAPELHVVAHHDHFGLKGFLLMAFGPPSTSSKPAELGGSARYYDGKEMHQVGFGAGSLMSVGKWVHLAATNDGTTVRIHVDGKMREHKNVARHPNADFSGELRIGQNVLADEFAWGGLIDDVRISRVARYSETDFVPAPRLPTDANTIALWQFDEGEGSVAKDATGKHPGTIRGATWVPAPCDTR